MRWFKSARSGKSPPSKDSGPRGSVTGSGEDARTGRLLDGGKGKVAADIGERTGLLLRVAFIAGGVDGVADHGGRDVVAVIVEGVAHS